MTFEPVTLHAYGALGGYFAVTSDLDYVTVDLTPERESNRGVSMRLLPSEALALAERLMLAATPEKADRYEPLPDPGVQGQPLWRCLECIVTEGRHGSIEDREAHDRWHATREKADPDVPTTGRDAS